MSVKKLTICLILILLAGCNPYEGLQTATKTVTAESTGTESAELPNLGSSISTPPLLCTVTTGISDGSLNIRTGAGIEYPVITTLTEGQILTLTGHREKEWIEVVTGNLSGWINSRYCK